MVACATPCRSTRPRRRRCPRPHGLPQALLIPGRDLPWEGESHQAQALWEEFSRSFMTARDKMAKTAPQEEDTMIVHELTEAGAVLAQALIRDPVVVRAIRSGDRWAIERAVEPHGLGAEEALVLLAVAIPGRN